MSGSAGPTPGHMQGPYGTPGPQPNFQQTTPQQQQQPFSNPQQHAQAHFQQQQQQQAFRNQMQQSQQQQYPQRPQNPLQQAQNQNSGQNFAQNPPQAQGPRSPGANAPPYRVPATLEEKQRERQRLEVILELNSYLFAHTQSVLNNKSNPSSPQSTQSNQNGGIKLSAAQRQEYQVYLRMLQANIAWVATVQARGKMMHNRTLPGPAIMEPPAGAAKEILERYKRLKELFPEWKGVSGADKPGPPNRQRSGSGMSTASMGSQMAGMPGMPGGQGPVQGQGIVNNQTPTPQSAMPQMQQHQQRQMPGPPGSGPMGGGNMPGMAFGHLGQTSSSEGQGPQFNQQHHSPQVSQGMNMGMGMGMSMSMPQTMNPQAMMHNNIGGGMGGMSGPG